MTTTPYATLQEANSYLAPDQNKNGTWNGLSDEIKNNYLIMATRRLNLESYIGRKSVNIQENQWPRTGAVCEGRTIGNTEIPIELKNATSNLAGEIALTPTVVNTSSGTNIKRLKAGSVETEFFSPQDPSSALVISSPDTFALLSCLLDNHVDTNFVSGSTEYVDLFDSGTLGF